MKRNTMLFLTVALSLVLMFVGLHYAFKFYTVPIQKEVHCYYYMDGVRTDDYYTIEDGKISSMYSVVNNILDAKDKDSYNKLALKNNNEYKGLLRGFSFENDNVTEYSYYYYPLMNDFDKKELGPLLKSNDDFKLEKDFFKYKYSDDNKYHCDWDAF